MHTEVCLSLVSQVNHLKPDLFYRQISVAQTWPSRPTGSANHQPRPSSKSLGRPRLRGSSAATETPLPLVYLARWSKKQRGTTGSTKTTRTCASSISAKHSFITPYPPDLPNHPICKYPKKYLPGSLIIGSIYGELGVWYSLLDTHWFAGRGLTHVGQLYTLVIGRRPFEWLWDVDRLVAQMIHFVEDLPSEWRPEWSSMKKSAGRNWSDIPGMIKFPPMCFTPELANVAIDRMTGQCKLDERFEKYVKEASLRPLLPIIRGLMRFRPQDRISAQEALRLLGDQK